MEFWLIATTMILVAMALVAMPMMRAPRQEMVSDQNANVAYFREQEQELAGQVDQGVISGEDAQQVRAELEKKLLNDMAGATQVSYQSESGRWLACSDCVAGASAGHSALHAARCQYRNKRHTTYDVARRYTAASNAGAGKLEREAPGECPGTLYARWPLPERW